MLICWGVGEKGSCRLKTVEVDYWERCGNCSKSHFCLFSHNFLVLNRAAVLVWWPGLSVHILQNVENKWQHLFTTTGRTQRVLFICTSEVTHITVHYALTIEASLEDIFNYHGIPETIMSDNELQYSGTSSKDFPAKCEFTYDMCSPRYHQANREAE